jgi:hypothetical protein
MAFKKATKEQCTLRAALFGPSGAGKTYTALRMAKGMGGKIALIDTERGSASKYADRFEFDVCELEDKTIESYIATMREAGAGGYGILIIDSLSHAWAELLAEVDKLAKAKYSSNRWSAWSEGTPKQMSLIEALLDYPGHVIATMRSRTEWTQEPTDRGKSKPVRVGLAPYQGKGIEYEFDFLVEISPEHTANVIKDRSGQFQDMVVDKPDETFGEELAAWLKTGAEPSPEADRDQLIKALTRAHKEAGDRGVDEAALTNAMSRVKGKPPAELDVDTLRETIAGVEALEADNRTRAEQLVDDAVGGQTL